MVLTGCASQLGPLASPKRADFQRAAEMLRELGIEHLANRSYTEISGGEQQMALIARALMQNARILMMDEPTAALDFGNQVAVLQCIKSMASRGHGIIMTSHNKAAEVGIPLVNCMFKTFDEMKQSIELTAQVLGGDAPDIAKKYNAELDQVLADTKAKTDKLADSERVSVMHGNSVYTLTIDGTDTVIDDWIKAAGGKNAVTESTKGNAAAEFTMEQVVAWNPDVIITGKADEVDRILNDPNWASINAAKNGKVYVNPKGVFGWDRYGVEELLQIQWAAATLHPELFSDLDINSKVKDFHKTYLNYSLTDSDVELILAAKNPA